jgi:hypothetical protein
MPHSYGAIRERPIAVVDEQFVGRVAAGDHEQILISIVVEVADRAG